MDVVIAFRAGQVWRVKIDGEEIPTEYQTRQEVVDWFREKKKAGDFQNYFLLIND